MSYLNPQGMQGLGCDGRPCAAGCGAPAPKPMGLFPPEGLTDWLGLAVIGYLGYKFFWDPHAGEGRRTKARAYGRYARIKAKRLARDV